jgi:hypothetical protein
MGFSSFITENLSDKLQFGNKDYGYVNEANFSAKNLTKVAEAAGKILGRKLGGEFKVIGLEKYKGANGPGTGVRCMNNAGAQIRFNFDAKIASMGKGTNSLTSLSYWSPTNANFEQANNVIIFHPQANIVEIMSKVGESLNAGKIVESILSEKTQKEVKAWLANNDAPQYWGSPDQADKLDSRLAKKGLGGQFAIFMGEPETNTFEDVTLQVAQSEFKSTKYANPDTVFQDVEQLLKVVAARKWKSLVVCGAAGVGKTFHVTEGPESLEKILGPEGDKWTLHTGMKAAPFAFYKMLFMERDKIIVLDEADLILKNDDIIIMLKSILDSGGKNYAEYPTGTTNMVGKSEGEVDDYAAFVEDEIINGAEITQHREKSGLVRLPSKFKFTGGIVFISNMPAEKVDTAIMSRSIFIDIYLAEQDRMKRIETIGQIMADNDPDLSQQDMDEILEALGASSPNATEAIDYMTPQYARQSKELSLRAISLSIAIKKANLKDWQRLVGLYT